MEEHLNSAVSCGPLAAAQEMITDGHPARPEHGSQSISHQDFPGAQCDVSKVALTAASWAHQKLGSQSLVSRLLRWEARFAHQTRANTPSQLPHGLSKVYQWKGGCVLICFMILEEFKESSSFHWDMTCFYWLSFTVHAVKCGIVQKGLWNSSISFKKNCCSAAVYATHKLVVLAG